MKLEDLKIYQLSMDLAEKVWNNVRKWDDFSKDTIGKQLIKSVDSVSANISEGFGRYHFKDVKNFGYYSRGSLYEAKTWLTKAQNRGLIEGGEFDQFMRDINDLGVRLNNYIKSIGNIGGNQVGEDLGGYEERHLPNDN